MITPAYAPTATERVLPRLALDFTTASLDPRVTVTRALNTATRINSSGYIEGVNADLPRFDFNAITLACRGLLIEETRENKLTYSNGYANAPWQAREGTLSTPSQTAPDGSATTYLLTENTASAQHELRYSFTFAGTTTYTLSIYAKSNGRNLLVYADGYGGGQNFNLANGTVGATVGTAPSSATITAMPNGFYRCTITFTWGAGSTANIRFLMLNGTTNSYVGDGTSGVYFYGAQLEAGAFATSYIPTTTTSLTRNADVVQMTGTNFSDWFNASEGTFVVNMTAQGQYPWGVSIRTNTSNRMELYAQITGSMRTANFDVFSSGSVQASLQSTASSASPFKIVGAYKTDSFATTIAGNAVVQDTLGSVPACTTLFIGSRDGAQFFANNPVAQVFYYPQRLINAEVQAFSK